MITTDQYRHEHHQYDLNHHDDNDDDDDQEHPARAGQREDGEQEVQQPEPDHVEPFCPGWSSSSPLGPGRPSAGRA